MQNNHWNIMQFRYFRSFLENSNIKDGQNLSDCLTKSNKLELQITKFWNIQTSINPFLWNH